MKKETVNQFVILAKCLGISLITITFTRLLLYWFNRKLFDAGQEVFLNILWKGMKFDLAALAAFQAPFIIFFFIPLSAKWTGLKQAVLSFFFGLANLLFILLNGIDSIYYRFVLKRSTADLFAFITTGDDTLRLLPRFITDYWYLVVLMAVVWAAGIFAYKSIRKPVLPQALSASYLFSNTFSLIFAAAFAVLAIRGGVQLKPLRTMNAAEAAGIKNSALVLNTPFTIMKSFNKKGLRPVNYFEEETVRELYSAVIELPVPSSGEMKKRNVVLIIMESFSKEYMGKPFGLEGKTPFLDSLAKEGLFFNQAYANGKKSIEGIPAILAGIPSLMEEPYITSLYAGNQVETVGSKLKEEGYRTAFFHGGKRGTMGFDAFSRLAGFDTYYAQEDYTGPEGYDGNWGIYDELFFQYAGNEINKMDGPFFATIFSLSSHHPYKIPPQYEKVFTGSKHPLLNTVAYADMALRKFFEQVAEMPWYNNTLFVITADHTGESFNQFYSTQAGKFAVPLLYFSPGDSTLKGVSEKITQQINIGPDILGYLQYGKPVFSFGRNIMGKEEETEEDFALNYLNNVYQFISSGYILHYNGEKSIGFYDYKADSLLQHNLTEDPKFADLLKSKEKKCKAIIQTYHHSLINNRQTAGAYLKP